MKAHQVAKHLVDRVATGKRGFCFELALAMVAARCLAIVSALVSIAPMNPNSSRATAVAILL
jgi:hypothetical protein